MTTKEQERKALEQIRKIVEDMGEGSYIAIAMEGVLDDAAENIENDWACSNYDRWQLAEQRLEEEKAKNRILEERCKNLDTLRVEENKKVMDLQQRYDNCRTSKTELHTQWVEIWNRFCEEQRTVRALQDEIIKLKARLYDFMVKEED